MVLNVHAGHNPSGMVACGCVGYLNESVEARKVKDNLIEMLRENGHTVYDCTCNDGISQKDVLNTIIEKCNKHEVDIDISIHLNAGQGTGVETWVYSSSSRAVPFAEKVCERISMYTGCMNRGVRYNRKFSVLRRTNASALIVECCFVDNELDYTFFDARLYAIAIYEAVTGDTYKGREHDDSTECVENEPQIWHRVYVGDQTGAFKSEENAEKFADELRKQGYTVFVE